MVLIYLYMFIFEFMFCAAGLQYHDVSISFIRQIEQHIQIQLIKHVRIISCDQNVTKFVGMDKNKISNLLIFNKLEIHFGGATSYLIL